MEGERVLQSGGDRTVKGLLQGGCRGLGGIAGVSGWGAIWSGGDKRRTGLLQDGLVGMGAVDGREGLLGGARF